MDTKARAKLFAMGIRAKIGASTTSLLLLVAFVVISTSAFADAAGLQELNVKRETVRFVGPNGNDDWPGMAAQPWATINYAAEQLAAGDTVIIRGGRYLISSQVRLRNSGRPGAWISFVGYAGEKPIIDARFVPYSSLAKDGADNGAFQIENVSYVRVINLTIANSHDAGFTVRDSSNIDLINNSSEGTFSSGIAVWDSDHRGQRTRHIRVLGNTITKATSWNWAPLDLAGRCEQPQEALSLAGAVDFEIAYNHIFGSYKEGIDVKETSKNGQVHHNLVNNVDRQGIYVDAWFGDLGDVKVFSNVIHDCRGAGIVLSAENGRSVKDVVLQNNLVFNNDGSGLLFSRFGVDNPRWNVLINKNIFYHNGYGRPSAEQEYYWITGGLYFHSVNVHDVSVTNNIFSENRGFQIGYSELYLKQFRSWNDVAQEKNIQIKDNLIDGRNSVASPIKGGGAPSDRVDIYATNGDDALFGSSLFNHPDKLDFTFHSGFPANHLLREANQVTGSWWKRNFPPRLVRIRLN
jgi:Right handed beta helix region